MFMHGIIFAAPGFIRITICFSLLILFIVCLHLEYNLAAKNEAI